MMKQEGLSRNSTMVSSILSPKLGLKLEQWRVTHYILLRSSLCSRIDSFLKPSVCHFQSALIISYDGMKCSAD
jgi:hypothetical protein